MDRREMNDEYKVVEVAYERSGGIMGLWTEDHR